MLELVIVAAVLYVLSVAVSFVLIKLVFDDLPAKYSLIPVLNVLVLAVDVARGGSRRSTGRPIPLPMEELDREQARISVDAETQRVARTLHRPN